MCLKGPHQLDSGLNRINIIISAFFCQLFMLGTWWIDVCRSDCNLLAAGGRDNNLKIYDRRESRIVKIFGDGLHEGIMKFVSRK
mgnify:CR=1 FL=1